MSSKLVYNYLYLAEAGCVICLSKKKDFKLPKMSLHKDLPSYKNTGFITDMQEDMQPEYLFFAIIFNIKHAMELIMKDIIADDNTDKTHDIKRIFITLQKKVSKINNKNFSEKISQDKLLTSFRQSKGKLFSFKGDIQELERLVEKYYTLEILQKLIGKDYNIVDPDNTASKYELNNLQIKFDYEIIGRKIKKHHIRELYKDIFILHRIYPLLSMLLRLI